MQAHEQDRILTEYVNLLADVKGNNKMYKILNDYYELSQYLLSERVSVERIDEIRIYDSSTGEVLGVFEDKKYTSINDVAKPRFVRPETLTQKDCLELFNSGVLKKGTKIRMEDIGFHQPVEIEEIFIKRARPCEVEEDWVVVIVENRMHDAIWITEYEVGAI